MVYQGILNRSQDVATKSNNKEPDFFVDLNLDQIIDEISRKYEKYDVKTLLLNPLFDVEDLKYRQEVFSDLESKETLEALSLVFSM
ncbi:MAG: hypothetical protein QXU18_08120 [Thermoplasmatales archaeon]